MIRAVFHFPFPDVASFCITGHSGFAEHGSDIVCAAVSSAAYLTANTVTEILNAEAEADVRDGYMEFTCRGSMNAVDMVQGLRLHLQSLQEQYPTFIRVTTEV